MVTGCAHWLLLPNVAVLRIATENPNNSPLRLGAFIVTNDRMRGPLSKRWLTLREEPLPIHSTSSRQYSHKSGHGEVQSCWLTAWCSAASGARVNLEVTETSARRSSVCSGVLGCPTTAQDRFDSLNTLSLHLVELAFDVRCNGPDVLRAGTSFE